MKKFTKILSMVLLIAMCVSMFGGSAFADEVLPADHSCTDYIADHGVKKVEAVPSDCETPGTIEYYMCGRAGCDKCYYDAECTQHIDSVDKLAAPLADHSFTSVPAVEPNCKDGGNLAYQVCSVCGAVADMSGTIHDKNGEKDFLLNPVAGAHVWGDWTEVKAPTAEDDGREERECVICGEKQGRDVKYESAFEIFSKNGKYSYTYNDANDLYGYQIVDPSHKLAYVTANGAEIDVYSYDAKKGVITLDGSEFSSSKDVVIYLKFVSEDGAIVEGFSISKPANQKTEEIEVNGVGDYDYVKGSGLNVNFKTNSQLGEIVLYDMNDRVPVSAIFSSQ
ncbi:MAG: hypothetical protein IJO77_00870, partial [Oscillospiraceae bacterium]|nr:hypothetical protein [Oscillospiraceae bacterium]